MTGAIYFNTQTGQIEQWDGAAWVGRTDFGSGTVMLFKQATAPTGWTRVVDAGNTDATIILRLNGEVPGVGGSWTITGGASASHVLTLAEIPSHAHSINMFAAGEAGTQPKTGDLTAQGAVAATNAAGGGGGHSHALSFDGTWRPKRVDVIVASKS